MRWHEAVPLSLLCAQSVGKKTSPARIAGIVCAYRLRYSNFNSVFGSSALIFACTSGA